MPAENATMFYIIDINGQPVIEERFTQMVPVPGTQEDGEFTACLKDSFVEGSEGTTQVRSFCNYFLVDSSFETYRRLPHLEVKRGRLIIPPLRQIVGK